MRLDKRFAQQILEITDRQLHKLLGAVQDGRVILGGSAGSAGGVGDPPAGFWGQLKQANVTYDTAGSRPCSSGSAGSDSLVDNLDRIRLGWEICDDAINEDHIDWGFGAGQVSAVDVPFQSTSGSISATNVRDAIEEVFAASGGSGVGTDELVKVTADDTTADYLLNKLSGGAGITLTELNPGGDEDVEIKVDNVPLADLADYAQGSLIKGGAADWDTLAHPGGVFRGLISTAAELEWKTITYGSTGDSLLGTTAAGGINPNMIGINTSVPGNAGQLDSRCGAEPVTRFLGYTSSGSTMEILHLVRERSGAVGIDGMGARQVFQVENSLSSNEDAVAFDAIWDDATSGSEDSRLDILLRKAGAGLAWFGRLLNSGFMVALGLWVAGDCHAFRVRNNSGGAVSAGAPGYIDLDGTFKTTTDDYLDAAWCVVVWADPGNDGDGDSDDDLYVANRGRVTVTLTANCSVGDYLYLSTTAGRAIPHDYMRPEMFAIARTANAAGAGGTCEALLLCHTRFIPLTSTNNIWYVITANDSDFVALIDDNAGAHGGQGLDATHVPYDTVTAGNENVVDPVATTELAKMVLWNTTRSTERLVTSLDAANDWIGTVNTADAWADNDAIEIRSQTCSVGGAYEFFDLDFSETTEVPELTRAIQVRAGKNDSGGAGAALILHPYQAYAGSRQAYLFNQVAGQYKYDTLVVALSERRCCCRFSASGAATASQILLLMGVWVAEP